MAISYNTGTVINPSAVNTSLVDEVNGLSFDMGRDEDSPRTISSTETRFVIRNKTFEDESELFFIESGGADLTIFAQNVKTTNCGELFRTASNAANDSMRNVRLVMQDCQINGGSAAKGIYLGAVGITSASIERCRFTDCEKAAIQFGDADLYQTSRSNITIRDCWIDGVVNRGGGDEESHGIFLLACQNFLVDNCDIRNINSIGSGENDVDCEGFYSKARDGFIRNCRFFNAGKSFCTVKGTGEQHPWSDAETPDSVRKGERIIVEGCTFRTDGGDYLTTHSPRGFYCDYGGELIVRNNYFEELAVGCRIEGADPSTGYIHILDNFFTYMDGLPIHIVEAYKQYFVERNRYAVGVPTGIIGYETGFDPASVAGSVVADNTKYF